MRDKAQSDRDGTERLLNRRDYLAAAGGGIAAALGIGTASAESRNDWGDIHIEAPLVDDSDTDAAEEGDTSSAPAIGGGDGYARTVSPDAATVTVATSEELSDALEGARSGDVVYVDGDADVDTGTSEFAVPSGVTLASDRGIDGSKGGQLRTSDSPWGMLTVGDDARVTGLRIGGPRWDWIDNTDAELGVAVDGTNVEVDNCEIYGWGYASVTTADDTHVHHNEIHHNPMDGTGYGVSTTSSENPLIEYNEFHHNRHSVASSDGGYVARYNHVKEGARSHVFDQHKPGGTTIEIYNNTVEAVEHATKDKSVPAVAIRGVPDDVAAIHDNWFFNPKQPRSSPSGDWTDEAIIQVHTDEWQNVDFHDNHYGPSEPDAGIGHPR